MSDISIHPHLQGIRDNFARIFAIWKSIRDNVPKSTPIQNFTFDDFDKTMLSVDRFLISEESVILFNPAVAASLTKGNYWVNGANNLENVMRGLAGNPQLWNALVDHLNNFVAPLSAVFFIGPNFTPDKALNQKLKEKLASLDASTRSSEELLAAARNGKSESDKLFQSLKTLAAEIDNTAKRINAELKQLSLYKEGINREGLGSAFAKKASSFSWPLGGWLTLFIFCILGIVTSGVIMDLKINSGKDFWQILPHVLVIGPLVWLAWFAGRQFSVSKRLREDYSFKSVTAMAYYGYSNEVSANEQLKNKLLDGAIENFNNKPDRIFDSTHRVSPFEEAVTEIAKKADPAGFAKLVEAFRSLVPGKP